MPYLSLRVTRNVLEEIANGNHFQRQVAITQPSADLQAIILTARANNKIEVSICGEFELLVGDPGAIWASHQAPGRQADDFENLFNLLARRPDKEVKFIWE